MADMNRLIALITWIVIVRSEAYDYTSSCTRPYRSSRTTRPQAPCDLSKHGYCTTPGNSYPWHAVRKFVHDNQGLMRRMYGEQRHIAVLKAEIENEISDEDYWDEEMQKAASFAEELLKNNRNFVKNQRSLYTRPHFRPISKNNDRNKNLTTTQNSTEPSINKMNTTYSQNSGNITQEIINNDTVDEETTVSDQTVSYKTKLESIANVEINNIDPYVIKLEAVIKQSIESNSVGSNDPASAKSEIIEPESTTSTIENSATETTAELEKELTEAPTTLDFDNQVTTTTETVKTSGWKPVKIDSSTLPPTLLFSEHDKLNKNVNTEQTKPEPVSTSEKVKEEFHLKHQESVRPTVLKLRGVNACSVKEEVAAPFWANSTRGEVLALLNMYPFEQYVHLETCTQEKKQMYCREGCRCEQQYRLHRLLAYDPHNECRGIFAEWFRFPSCCVCKCYDVPLEYRMTSRSPRVLAPQYDEEAKRAIYEDVAKDWYTISTFSDDVDIQVNDEF